MNCKHGLDSNKCGHCTQEGRDLFDLASRRRISKIARILSLDVLGGCACCGIPNSISKFHDLDYGNGRGSFIICELCWEFLEPLQRLGFYRKFWEKHWSEHGGWEEITSAILGEYTQIKSGFSFSFGHSDKEDEELQDYFQYGKYPELP